MKNTDAVMSVKDGQVFIDNAKIRNLRADSIQVAIISATSPKGDMAAKIEQLAAS